MLNLIFDMEMLCLVHILGSVNLPVLMFDGKRLNLTEI